MTAVDPCIAAHNGDDNLPYLAWHEWAAEKAKTHKQIKCPHCGLYRVWIPKKGRP